MYITIQAGCTINDLAVLRILSFIMIVLVNIKLKKFNDDILTPAN